MIYIKKDKVKNSGECPIYFKILFKQQSITISTGKYISEERWVETDNLRRKLRVEKEKVLKEYLDLYVLKIEKIYNQIVKYQEDINISEFKLMILGKHKDDAMPTLLDIIDKHNQYFAKLVDVSERSKASLQKYKRVRDLIETFNSKKYGFKDIQIEKVNSGYIYNLESFLKFESEYKGKLGIKNNSTVKYFKNLKTICNYALKMELIEKNPFNLYSGKIKEVETCFLTEEELERIENKDFKIDRLERVKDIFLFSCYTGYAPVDALKLTRKNIIQDANKNLWIKTNRQKTDSRSNVPLLPQVIRIINKYQFESESLLPKISNQKMNAYLKEIAEIVGLDKNLTWYVSRHTFATTVTLGNGIKIENVSAMLGHKTIRQTQHYAKILDSSVSEDMQKLMEKFRDK
ncbi:site-specific integrase [Flavobacterium aciduliphilum]|uniref:Site-specific recombinase XerD n=1 Tax=Flavobacterium aciduliphilum TaxID=1101402 RepID=A0A328YM04_9FLAO|nr:site-specific integrase [Flavobacterium aciduliphilum]RAR73865.1 site-specific recombinase XerD [Flavobacterium aciduliphilum]